MKTTIVALFMIAGAISISAQTVNVKPPKVKVDIDNSISAALGDVDVDIDFGGHDKRDKRAYQQSTQEIEIPLSNPGERGTLKVDSKNGRIKITAYDGGAVKVKIIKYEKKVSESKSGGMKLISSGGFNFEASESDNFVKVENEGWNNRSDFEIMVPRNFDIQAQSYNNGYIEVSGVEGELDIESYNGPISLTEISGSASASTYNGAIEVIFSKLTPDVPMTFSTYNGDVDLTVPNGAKFSTKMRTNRDIYTDFDSFSLSNPKPVSEKNDSRRGYSIKYENWVQGDLNGGGPEVIMKTRNGNIYIRKGE